MRLRHMINTATNIKKVDVKESTISVDEAVEGAVIGVFTEKDLNSTEPICHIYSGYYGYPIIKGTENID